MILRRAPTNLLLLSLVACGPDYSPDTYATNAVQQANKVEQGVVIGVRDVAVSANGTMGAVTGGAAGGIAGSQVGVGPVSAFTALGGTLVGGITGSAIEHASGDTKAFEYIVRKTGNELVSVTQKDKAPLVLGQRVLVIAGNQARLVPDYTIGMTSADKARAAEASSPDAGRAASARVPPAPGAEAVVLPATLAASVGGLANGSARVPSAISTVSNSSLTGPSDPLVAGPVQLAPTISTGSPAEAAR